MTLKEFLAHPKVKRISVGRCVDGTPWEDTETQAHAHADPQFLHYGWICVRNPRDILCTHSNNVSRTMMHELCHLTGHIYHNDRWRNEMHRQKQPIPRRYQKKKRRRE